MLISTLASIYFKTRHTGLCFNFLIKLNLQFKKNFAKIIKNFQKCHLFQLKSLIIS